MNGSLPAVVDGFIEAEARLFAPPAIYEIGPAVSLCGPDQTGKRVHDAAEIDLHVRTLVAAHRQHAPTTGQISMILSARVTRLVCRP